MDFIQESPSLRSQESLFSSGDQRGRQGCSPNLRTRKDSVLCLCPQLKWRASRSWSSGDEGSPLGALLWVPSVTGSLAFSLVTQRKGFLREHSSRDWASQRVLSRDEAGWTCRRRGPSLLSGSPRVNLHSSLAALPLSRACWDFLPAVLHHEDLCVGEIPGHSCN